MDLLKMHPMARKMEQHQQAFLRALEDGDGSLAKQHLTEVQKLTDFLVEDLHNEIVKSEKQPTHGALDIYAGGAAVMKFQNRERHAPSGGHLVGSKSTASHVGNFRPHSGTFGRRV